MKINIIAIGKLKEKFWTDALAEYLKRCSRFAEVNVVELAEGNKSLPPAMQSQVESDALTGRAKGFVVALDPRGKQLDSKQFAELIAAKCGEGTSEFSFLVGGSHGLSDSARAAADEVLSFGKPTFPHQLFRVMLAEQVYRALTINAGVPYHK